MGDARNDLLQGWKDLGGRTALIDGLKNAFEAVAAVLKPIQEAFREIFPKKTARDLYNATVTFRDFMKSLKIGADTASDLKRIFAGVFAAFDIGWKVVKGLFGVFRRLFGTLTDGAGGVLDFLANIGDMIVNFNDALESGKGLENFFKGLGDALEVPVELLKSLGGLIAGFFNGFSGEDADRLSDLFSVVGEKITALAGIGGQFQKIWDRIADIFSKVRSALQPLADVIGGALSGLGSAIADALDETDWNAVFDAINLGLLAGIAYLIKKFLSSGIKLDVGGGLFESIKGTFGALTDTLTAMQTQIKAKSLLMIAGAVGILTASVVALSLIDSRALMKALVGLGGVFSLLLGATAILDKIANSAGIVKMPVIAGAMIMLASAVLILSAAVKLLSTLSWSELTKGLIGVAAVLAMIVGVAYGLNAAGGPMLRAGLAMIPLATGLLILAGAVKIFASMEMGDLAKGLLGLAFALGAIALAINAMPASVILIGPGLIAVGIAIGTIASAMLIFGGMSWENLVKGMLGLGGALLIIAAAVALIPVSIVLIGPALIAVGIAIAEIAAALKIMGSMSWEEIGKSMVVLAGALAILAGGR